MKTLFIAFLVATVCIGKGIPLKCYSCPLTSLHGCSRITECKESDKYCITQHIFDESEIIVFDGYNRKCSSFCPKSYEDKKSRRDVLKCCDTDKCNGP